jgi:hypothetical protein
MGEHRPDFLIVCDHGDRGKVDRVGLLSWFPEHPGWWPATVDDEAAIRIWPMEADQRGWNPKWLRPEVDTSPDDLDRRRFAIEIRCLDEHCTTWEYRSEDDKFQSLLMKIATDGEPCGECGLPFAVTVVADDARILVALQQLHLAREHAKHHYGLRV